MFQIPLKLEQIYDGAGRHLGGIYPPLLVNNVLTPAYNALAAARPVMRDVGSGPPVTLGLVWMMPLGLWLIKGAPTPHLAPEAFGAVVQALDAGLTVHIYGDNDALVSEIVTAACAMVGGGHA